MSDASERGRIGLVLSTCERQDHVVLETIPQTTSASPASETHDWWRGGHAATNHS
jgi:hypothetical protein